MKGKREGTATDDPGSVPPRSRTGRSRSVYGCCMDLKEDPF